MNPPAPLTSWFEPDQIYACPYPDAAALHRLAANGIGLVINLETVAHNPVDLESAGLREVHLPCPDFTTPTQEQILTSIATIAQAIAEDTRVAIHCRAGLGRTGTVLACWLVSQGTPAEDAILEVRRRRPGSIETDDQEAAIRTFASSTQ